MTLECSVVIFQALEYLWPQWPQQPQQPQWPQWPQQPHFTKQITEFYVSINHGTKKTYPGLSMWNGSSKTHYFIDFSTLSLGGCGGHPMRPKLNLKVKSQMSSHTYNIKSNLTCSFISVTTKLKKTFCPRTLWTMYLFFCPWKYGQNKFWSLIFTHSKFSYWMHNLQNIIRISKLPNLLCKFKMH